MLHHTLYTSLFMFYTVPWNGKLFIPLWVNENLGTLHSRDQNNPHTHTHTTLPYIYIKHFTSQAIFFLKALLLMQKDQICDCIHYLTSHIIMKVWVRIVDSILHHHKWIFKMRFTCLLYTHWHIFYTSLCTFLWKIGHITWRMLSMTSCFSPYTSYSCGHISLMQTLSVH
jgi:hypothetical protein